MSRILAIIFLMIFGAPVFADIVNPNLTREQREAIQAQRIKRYRMTNISRVCGYSLLNSQKLSEEDINNCKQNLRRDYEMNLKFLESYIKESRNEVDKDIKNTAKQ